MKMKTYSFEGPYTSVDSLSHSAGVYGVLDRNNEENTVVDIGESSDVKTRLQNHEREPCWFRQCNGTIWFVVLYTPGFSQQQRRAIEQELRAYFQPVCGLT